MKVPFSDKINIRWKLFSVLAMTLVSIGLLGLISFYNFSRIESKFMIVESAYEINNEILEIRRYEKNYFLYSSETDYLEAKRYLSLVQNKIEKIEPSIEDREQKNLIQRLLTELDIYDETLSDIHLSGGLYDDNKNVNAIKLRVTGQTLVNLAHNLVDYERQLILKINNRLSNNLLLSAALVILLFVFFIIFIAWMVIRPLKMIEIATQSIAKGEFRRLEVWDSKDEIHQVMVAFNKMVDELERRQDQLVQAQKLSSIGTLASGIAHQVNNPLNNISTSCQIMMEECGDISSELAKRMMGNIESETFRARDIVRGLLEFSRQNEFIKTRNNLKDVVASAVRLASSQVSTGIEIIQQIPENIELEIDRQRFQEVFINLVINAVHAIAPDHGTISIFAVVRYSLKKVVITVEDTGKGIPLEIRNQIFDPFFTTKDVGIGTGLGLYVVYGIVKRHDGDITAENLLTGGAKFTITLPLPSDNEDN